MTKTNGNATEIVSVHSSELPRAYREELTVASYASVGGATRHTLIVRACVCVSVRSSSERRQKRISWW